jgi:hypothetical protein
VAGNIQGKAPCYAVQKGTTEIACFFILSWAKREDEMAKIDLLFPGLAGKLSQSGNNFGKGD